jgi:hypothetical protein
MGDLSNVRQYIIYRQSVLRSPRCVDPFYQCIFGVCAAKNHTCYCERSKEQRPTMGHEILAPEQVASYAESARL